MNLKNIAAVLSVPVSESRCVTGVSIDSRCIEPGHLFVAMCGTRFDGHNFMQQAVEHGACAILCSRSQPDIVVPQLIVPDTLEALTKLALHHRKEQSCKVIALTGSNGKTTVKEMIATILPKPSFATPGNFNNHIGVPLSVLKLQSNHSHAVFELGANHSGEIAHTVAIVRPHVTLINNIAPAHIEGFGSIEGVAKAKGEIHQGLQRDGTAIINDDDDYAHYWDSFLTNKRVFRFSATRKADFYATNIGFDDKGCASFNLVMPKNDVIPVHLNVPGLHNVNNALAAAACTYSLDISLDDIAQGLQRFIGVSGRMTFRLGRNNATVIDDTYNANLRSVTTALEVLSKREGMRILVLGDMGELGEWVEQHHREAGRVARQLGIDKLMTYGQHSHHASSAFGAVSQHYNTKTELVDALFTQLSPSTTVLVKGSRAAAMETIVQQLLAD